MLMPIDSLTDFVDEDEISIELFKQLQDYRATLQDGQPDPLQDCVVTCAHNSDVKIRRQAFWDELGASGD